MKANLHIANLHIPVLLVAISAASAEASVDLYETYKDQTFEGEADVLSQNETYTLSKDYKFQKSDGTAVGLRYQAGNTFDFSDGNHTLTCAGIRTYANETGKAVAFKGGVWDMVETGSFSFGGWFDLDYTDWTWTVEDVVVTNLSSSSALLCGYGTNRKALIKRSTFYGNPTANVFQYTYSDMANGALLEFAEGSKFVSKSETFMDRYSPGALPLNFTLRFTGEGSGYVRASNGPNDFSLGVSASGERVEVLDGATFDTRWLFVGLNAPGCSNAFYVADGNVTCEWDTYVGNAEGADGNEIFVSGPKGSFANGAASILVGAASSFNTLTVSNDAQVACRSIILSNSGTASNNVARILDKGVAKLTNELKIGTVGGNNHVEIDGGTLQTDSQVLLGEGAPGNRVVISNGGLLKAAGSLNFCTGNNAVDIYSDATVDVSYVSMGLNAGSDGNRLRVLGGALLLSPDANLDVGYGTTKGDELIVSNGLLSVGDVKVGAGNSQVAGSDGNIARFMGKDMRLEWGSATPVWTPFGKGRDNLVEFSDDAEASCWRLYVGAEGSISNTMRITRGAKFTTTSYCFLSGGAVACSNVLEVSDGAMLTSEDGVQTDGDGTMLLISNATVRTKATYSTFFVGNGRIRLCGTHPLLTTYDNEEAHHEFREQTEVTFALPPDGTVYAQAPLQAAVGVNFHDTAMIRFENLEAFRSNLTQRVNVPLVLTTAEGQNSVSDELLAKVNAALVEQGCPWAQVRNSADKKLTFLHVKPDLGMVVIVR